MASRAAVAGPIVQTMRVRGLPAMEGGMGYTVAPRTGDWVNGVRPIYTAGPRGANGGVRRAGGG